MHRRRKSKYCSANYSAADNRAVTFPWIEKLITIPIVDFRKFVIRRVLAPYLVNIRKMPNDDAFRIIEIWLHKCESVRSLDFRADRTIDYNLRSASRNGYLPISIDRLKEQHSALYGLLNE